MHIRISCLSILAALVIAGCQAPSYDPVVTTVVTQTNTNMVSSNLLAQRLGLQMDKMNASFVTFKNSANTVTVFIYSGGEVYVNGAPVGKTGKVRQEAGQIYFVESIEQSIRSALIVAPVSTPPLKLAGTVVLDAGHGGRDPGATSATGYYEKEVNLRLSSKVASILRGRGLTTIMTRENDTFLELEERAGIANRYSPQLFVSIHHDSRPDAARRGYTVYIARSPSIASRQAARAIANAMSSTGLQNQGVSTADYRVLVQSRCPAVLIEAGHLSNWSEASLLRTADFQDRLAAAIADGIISAVSSR
jgi:N-acetylmuramoyl-L-alanine amidase